MTDSNNPTTESHDNNDAEHRTVFSMLRDIQSGTLDPRQISIPNRLDCVEYLAVVEERSNLEIAEILQFSKRQIERDRAVIKQRNALTVTPDMTAEIIGEFKCEAESAITRVARIARDRDSPPAVRLEAEKTCWQIRREWIETMQKLGYLRYVGPEMRGELTHHIDADSSMADVRAEIDRVLGIHQESPRSAVLSEQLGPLMTMVQSLLPASTVPSDGAGMSGNGSAQGDANSESGGGDDANTSDLDDSPSATATHDQPATDSGHEEDRNHTTDTEAK